MGVFDYVTGRASEKERRRAALQKQQELDEAHRDEVINEACASMHAALRLLKESNWEGVPRAEDVEQARDMVGESVAVFEREGVEGKLDERENETLMRLQHHEAGVKMGQKRLVATWTPAKQIELRELERRAAIAMLLIEADADIAAAQVKVDALKAGHEIRDFLKKRAKLQPSTAMHGSTKLLSSMLQHYHQAGWVKADRTALAVEEMLQGQGLRFMQRVYRGHRGRALFHERKWASEKLLAQATALFSALDATGDGQLEIDELQAGFARAGYSRAEIRMITRLLDADGSGAVDAEEFKRSFQEVLSGRAQMDEEDLAQEQGQPPDSEEEEEERRRAAGEGSSVEAPAGGSWQKRGSLGGRSKRSAALDGAEEDEEDGYFNHALPRDGGGSLGECRTGATDHLFGELHYAAQQGDIVRAWALIARARVPEDAETSAGTAAVHFAAAAGQAATCSLLAALGADVDKETAGGFTALHIAASGNQSACIHALARMRAKVDYQDSRHYAGPLHWAARGGHIDAVKALLEEGATLELRDRAGNTPLMWAAKHGNTRVVNKMAEAGAAVGAVSGEGRTALIHAAEHGHTETCMALVELGVHPTAVLLFGESAAELARSRGHPETARALEDAHAERANLNRISELEG